MTRFLGRLICVQLAILVSPVFVAFLAMLVFYGLSFLYSYGSMSDNARVSSFVCSFFLLGINLFFGLSIFHLIRNGIQNIGYREVAANLMVSMTFAGAFSGLVC